MPIDIDVRSGARGITTAAALVPLLVFGVEAAACTDTGFEILRLLSPACCYEGIRAKCGELSIGPFSSGRTFDAAASDIAKAVEREGGVLEISDPDLRYIVARFSRRANLKEIKAGLEAETSVRWVSYRPLVQHE